MVTIAIRSIGMFCSAQLTNIALLRHRLPVFMMIQHDSQFLAQLNYVIVTPCVIDCLDFSKSCVIATSAIHSSVLLGRQKLYSGPLTLDIAMSQPLQSLLSAKLSPTWAPLCIVQNQPSPRPVLSYP